jgi:hypothetical protein
MGLWVGWLANLVLFLCAIILSKESETAELELREIGRLVIAAHSGRTAWLNLFIRCEDITRKRPQMMPVTTYLKNASTIRRTWIRSIELL